jgi:hypothetical protein
MRQDPTSRSPIGKLVSGSFSNRKSRSRSRTKSRGRSRERSYTPTTTTSPVPHISAPALSYDDEPGLDILRSFSDIERELDVIRSLSEDEIRDDIFDSQERYSAGSPSSTMSPTSTQDSEETDEEDFFSSCDERDSASVTDEESIDNIDNDDNYLDRIIDKLQIMDVFEGIKAKPGKPNADHLETASVSSHDHLETASVSSDAEDNSYETDVLEMKLRNEVKRTKELEQKLREAERRHTSHSVRQQNNIISLESKLALQKRNFATQLKEEKQKRMRLGESRDEEEDECEERIDCSTERLNAKKRDLKKSHARTEANQHSPERAQTISDKIELDLNKMKIELDLNKMKDMIELEKTRCKELELSEARAQMLLSAEMKRVETMSNENAEMKAAMRNLSRKAMGRRNASDDVEDLRKQLKKKDDQISVITNILKNKPSNIHTHFFDSMETTRSSENHITLKDVPAPDLEIPLTV